MQKYFWKICSGYLPVVLWAGAIFFLSSQSSLPGFDVGYDYIFKKMAHMFVYGVLYFLVHRAINMDRTPAQRNAFWSWSVPFLFIFFYATTDEVHQIFTDNRHPSPIDVGFDMIGAGVAFLKIYRYI